MATDLLKRRGSDADFSLMPWLFPRPFREEVRAFERFVRMADDVTDNALTSVDERRKHLVALDRLLAGTVEPLWSDEANTITQAFVSCATERGQGIDQARRIVHVFMDDLAGHERQTWADVLAYCRQAAAPTGRYLLTLTDEDATLCGAPMDALCTALRILKQLRDCEDVTAQPSRLCIPVSYMADAAVDWAHMRAASARGQTRAVLDRVLDGVDQLLEQAASLPRLIRCPGLSIHTAVLLCRGRHLVKRFRTTDLLQDRVRLTWVQRQRCLVAAIANQAWWQISLER